MKEGEVAADRFALVTGAETAGVPQADGSIRPEPVMNVGQVWRAVAYC